ncbi:MAG TPA: metallophosphoesterase family protein [Blastocatellia bacterium]|nr:metallophosphoesterase family protein [Blastocatellia bacterium]
MRTIIHLSDLHFGQADQNLIQPLIDTIHRLSPDLIAVSGDLTQRARSAQFREARAFLDTLPQPQIVVPGNHDVPLHDVVSRFAQPLEKYRRYITDDLQPFYADDEMIVLGLNTARSLAIKGGRISRQQIRRLRDKLCGGAGSAIKIIVTHHPFDVPAGHDERDVVGRAQRAMPTLAECGADLFLAGHLHVSHTGHTATRYKIAGHSALVVQAGTAVSTRTRGEANSFNVLRLAAPQITVERLEWNQERGAFISANAERFSRTPAGWQRIAE